MATTIDDATPSNPPASNTGIHTYHCICTHLLLASTTALPTLPQRAEPGLCDEYILPLPSPPSSPTDAGDDEPELQSHYAILLGSFADGKPLMVRRDDGFEKRYLQRCGRCKVVMAYHLDWAQYNDADGEGKRKGGKRDDVVYVLPGGVFSTEDMVAGKRGDGRFE